MSNEQKNALITGASSGMGLSYSEILAKDGYNLFIISNQDIELTKLYNKLKDEYPSQKFYRLCLNLAESDAAENVMNYIKTNNIEVNLLINNAGIFTFKDISETDINLIETYIGLHILTITKLCKYICEKMAEEGGGRVINISSISAHTPYPGITLYSATKSYILNFTKAYALELKEKNIKMSVVSPGAVATNLYNLSERLQKIGIVTGIIMPPDRLVRRVLKSNNRGKIVIIPGIGNRLFKPIFSIIPNFIKLYIRKRFIKKEGKKY